ncbi:DNA adenine methylase [Paenibacillus xylanilyticus]|uniref:site-specific DNA-methyltransferase (adenine-specific) n=1 Tax=Paenibacillus xylanilyticus TaxID=248903 RepID=A0A7Y6EVH2_9BACL|nr:DNA adenine methylase [Paenibacillus xylanilyticus]NUU75729.1 DNA adenine methylase [Paenibacillus xylanilyticus]
MSMELVCRFCGRLEDTLDDIDSSEEGFWCDYCDGFTYFNSSNEHRFTLLLEEKGQKEESTPRLAAPKIKFNKQLSCLRYPGGKSKMIPAIHSKIRETKSECLVGAYAGGASAEFALLEAGVVKRLVLNDVDFGIYALYWTIKHAPYDLIYRLQSSSSPSEKDYFNAQKIIKKDYPDCTTLDAAWYTLLVNRLAYSGIYKANPLGGRNGEAVKRLSRWNPDRLIQRIEKIHTLSDRITVLNEDALHVIEEYYWSLEGTTIFVDPPFVEKGNQLYRHFYKKNEHVALNVLLESLYQGMPGADIIVTYDDHPLIRDLYYLPTTENIRRYYSI